VKQIQAQGEGEAEDRSLQGYSPCDPEDFGFDAWVYIGIEGEEGSDLFDLVVCSPSWLARELSSGRSLARFTDEEELGSVVLGPEVWYMPRWDRTGFEEALRPLCSRCSPAPGWSSVASRLGRYLAWEYDYKYDEYVDAHPGQFRLPRGWAGRSWKQQQWSTVPA
jgi:hypothetical protein